MAFLSDLISGPPFPFFIPRVLERPSLGPQCFSFIPGFMRVKGSLSLSVILLHAWAEPRLYAPLVYFLRGRGLSLAPPRLAV